MRNENAAIVAKVSKMFLDSPKGTTINHLQLQDWMGVDRASEQQKYYQLMTAIRSRLKGEGIFLMTVHKVGYYIRKPGEEIFSCYGQFVRGLKGAAKAVRDTSSIRIHGIEDAAVRQATIDRSSAMANTMGLLTQGMVD